MPNPLVSSASMLCSFGVAPSSLIVLPLKRVLVEGKPVATITDMAPIVNIPPFGMCSSLANPTVATATAAALGVLTPMPCIPVTVGPWKPPCPNTLIGEVPAVVDGATCNCAWGGIISVTFPGSVQTAVN